MEAQKQVTTTAEQKHVQHCNELQSSLKEARHAASSLQSQLAAVQLELATEQKRHQDAQHAVADLELQLQVTRVHAAGNPWIWFMVQGNQLVLHLGAGKPLHSAFASNLHSELPQVAIF